MPVMSMRGKVALTIIAIEVVVTVSTLGVVMLISESLFMDTIKEDILSMSKIASRLVSSEITRLREEINVAAGRLQDSQDIQKSLEEMTDHPPFLALSIIDRSSFTVLHAGDEDARPVVRSRESDYGKRAFNGESVITTTEHTLGGNLVMRIWSPIDEDRVLIATIPGLFLSDTLSQFQIWETGSLFVLDNEGVIISNIRPYIVDERHNYIEWGKRNPSYRRVGEVFQTIIQTDEGIEQYPLLGEDRICAYARIAGTDHWSIGVAAPINESPLSRIHQTLLIFAVVFIGLGIVIAMLAANNVAAPYEKMAELRKMAEIASESKSKFLANMSHEMRTPLNAIIGLSELELGSGTLEESTFSNVEKVYTAGISLLGIINDLLDVSKIESGKFTLVPVVYDVPSMINDTINLNIVRIGSKDIQFHLHLDASIPSRLKGDELRVKQIFNNLLSNAFKYTDSGSVDWHFTCEREGDRVHVVSWVQDSGQGIEKDDMVKLFKDDYYQAQNKNNYHVEGTGLGLPITNTLVKLMDGTIKVESEFGKGSTFSVEFFQEPSGEGVIGEEVADNLSRFRYSAQRRTRNQKLLRADMSYATVLVVDDVVTNLDVAKGMLKPYGITVDCVTSGQEAVNRIREEKIRYSAIFMDHMMPGMDGIEAVRIIRKEIGTEYAKNIPVIALTANALLGNEALFLENGFQAFLSKPIDILNLDRILNHWVRNKSQEKDRKQPENTENKKNGERIELFRELSIPGLKVSRGLARFENDGEAYLQILRSFATHTPALIETAKAANPDTLSTYRVAVHSVKGSGRGIGAEDLGNLAEKLEAAAVNGDFAFIESHNAAFIKTAEQLLQNISAFLEPLKNMEEEEKTELEAPSGDIIEEILRACEDYSIDSLKKAIDALDTYRYRSDPGLANWLREQAGKSNFEEIKQKLKNG